MTPICASPSAPPPSNTKPTFLPPAGCVDCAGCADCESPLMHKATITRVIKEALGMLHRMKGRDRFKDDAIFSPIDLTAILSPYKHSIPEVKLGSEHLRTAWNSSLW